MLSTLVSKAKSKLNAQWFYFGDQPNAAKKRWLINRSRESQIEPTLSSLPFQRQANMNGDSLQHSWTPVALSSHQLWFPSHQKVVLTNETCRSLNALLMQRQRTFIHLVQWSCLVNIYRRTWRQRISGASWVRYSAPPFWAQARRPSNVDISIGKNTSQHYMVTYHWN